MKKLVLLFVILTLLPLTALAEVYHVSDETHVPAEWAEKPILRMVVTDTNRSDAILLQCGGESMMVDGGFSTYYKRVFANLDRYGVTTLKYLFNTHCDGDHSSGLTSIINSDRYAPQVLLCPNPEGYDDPDDDHEKMVRAARKHGVPYQQIDDGDVFTLGDATITVIRCSERWGQNARSAACMVSFGDSKLLLLADVSSRVLNHFVQTRDHAMFDCDVIKAPHHGIDGIPEAFMDIATPEAILITNCSNNPHSKKLAQAGALFTGDGTVTAVTDGTDWYMWQGPNGGD